MSEKHHILLVDDDLMMQEIERHQLGEEKYRFSAADNGVDALVRVSADKPDVILLDVSMPDMDGLETCRRIRADEDNNDIHIIFVTAHDDDETRLAAYEAGGDDVLTKPLNPAEICRKVEVAVDNRNQVESLRQQIVDTNTFLMSTITTSGEYGVVMTAMRQSMGCKSLAELAEVMLKALEDFSLQGTIQLRAPMETLTINTERRSSALEQEMLLRLSLENKHIVDYGSRTAFCYPNVAVLVKNMPQDDADTYGRIKDNAALLAEAGEFRLKALADEISVRRQQQSLARSVALAADVLAHADSAYKRGQSEMAQIFDELERKLEWSLAGLGLTEDQEQGFIQLLRPITERAETLYDEGMKLDDQLSKALGALRDSLAMR